MLAAAAMYCLTALRRLAHLSIRTGALQPCATVFTASRPCLKRIRPQLAEDIGFHAPPEHEGASDDVHGGDEGAGESPTMEVRISDVGDGNASGVEWTAAMQSAAELAGQMMTPDPRQRLDKVRRTIRACVVVFCCPCAALCACVTPHTTCMAALVRCWVTMACVYGER